MLVGSLVQRLAGWLGLFEQIVEGLVVERQHFHWSALIGADGGLIAMLVEEFHFPEVFPGTELHGDHIRLIGPGQHDLHNPLGNDVERLVVPSLGRDHAPGSYSCGFNMPRGCQELVGRQRGQRLGHVFIDDLAVGDQRGAVGALGQPAVMRNDDDGLALRDQTR